jgi:dTDP-glucose 4,6-dehydratase
VDDHCRAIDLILKQGRIGETYNIGSGVEADVETIADRALETLGLDQSRKTYVPDRPGHDRRYLLDSTKLRSELGWAPQVELDDGLRATVEWYRANRDWWEPLKARAPVEETAWSS